MQAFGHESVSLLDGGLSYWKHSQYPLENGPAHCSPLAQRYTASYNPQLVKTLEQVQQHLTTGSAQVKCLVYHGL